MKSGRGHFAGKARLVPPLTAAAEDKAVVKRGMGTAAGLESSFPT